MLLAESCLMGDCGQEVVHTSPHVGGLLYGNNFGLGERGWPESSSGHGCVLDLKNSTVKHNMPSERCQLESCLRFGPRELTDQYHNGPYEDGVPPWVIEVSSTEFYCYRSSQYAYST